MHWGFDAMAEGVVYQFMPPLLDPEGINAQEKQQSIQICNK